MARRRGNSSTNNRHAAAIAIAGWKRVHSSANDRPAQNRGGTTARRIEMHNTRFPGETAAWRAARDALLTAECDLRRQVEAVAAQRRRLPLGAVVPEDYRFEGETGPVRLSELFAP